MPTRDTLDGHNDRNHEAGTPSLPCLLVYVPLGIAFSFCLYKPQEDIEHVSFFVKVLRGSIVVFLLVNDLLRLLCLLLFLWLLGLRALFLLFLLKQ